MRICFSVCKTPTDNLTLSDHFGESDRFVIFDTERATCLPHDCAPAMCKGPCRCFMPSLPQREFDVVICRSIGARAFTMLRRNQIEVFLTQESSLSTALNVWQAQNLHLANRGICRPEVIARRRESMQRKDRNG
jgi:predicted Fe-Mo cluster-binding NifX family protein